MESSCTETPTTSSGAWPKVGHDHLLEESTAALGLTANPL